MTAFTFTCEIEREADGSFRADWGGVSYHGATPLAALAGLFNRMDDMPRPPRMSKLVRPVGPVVTLLADDAGA